MKLSRTYTFLSVALTCFFMQAQHPVYTHADSLKGSVTRARAWWDVLHYDLRVAFDYLDSSIKGSNRILYKVLEPYALMQLDLMEPMQIDSIVQDKRKLSWKRDGNAFLVNMDNVAAGAKREMTVFFHGRPHVAQQPPWDGGIIWTKDGRGNPWVSIACQGMAAQVWFPNKDHQYDEVDSASFSITVPKDLVGVSNGRLRSKKINSDGTATFQWAVVNPINNYNIIPYIGKYVNFKDTLKGKGGVLDISYWVLDENLEKARRHFTDVKPMLRCFEHWFGKYPFYQDGYKLVEAPFLGMEHQSAIAYGNGYKNGYLGRDLSLTGWGLKWDFIVVHESGHEWFGNNITASDVADNWIHESFTAYSENLYTEWRFGKKAGAQYVIGTRLAIQNDRPMISDYNVNHDGSTDIYYKGANMLHTIRQIVDNDNDWRKLLNALNKTFWHQTVGTKQVEDFISDFLKLDLKPVFDQYLRTTQIPTLEYTVEAHKVSYRWTNCISGFDMPVRIRVQNRPVWVYPTQNWSSVSLTTKGFSIDENFYIKTKKLEVSASAPEHE